MAASTKPYLIRALHEWCSDNGHTPYIVVWVDGRTRVPKEFVKDNEIVLNIGYSATQGLKIDNEWLSFSARFGGVPREIAIPVGNVLSIFARETGEGMGFEVEPAEEAAPSGETESPRPEGESGPAGGARAHLRVVK
ncbi:ClpXP protease specificity-enhancing factor [Crenobacter luteus]|uniref:Stringent starvation protein B n=1 Tax=Crenobacter luteus TaxID=1452487 RepID=A0A165FDV9_9NEIS|nr:ClpXP protease specificity-enhancing factor [Crenobacter luteus]KZE32942.1 stringent starvation protein B [Crenobacter luteus]